MSTRSDEARPEGAQPRDRAEVAEEKLALPVIVAALASVPAVFLTMLEEPLATAGQVVNYASLAVLTTETVVLLLLSGDRVAWLKRHWWVAAIAVVSIPAVIFAVGPVQLLRLVRFLGALRIIRVGRIIKAGRILQERMGLTGPLRTAVVVVVTAAAAAFVALVLSDPTGQTRRFLDETLEAYGIVPVLVAGAILAVATFVVWRARGQTGDEDR